MDKVLKVIEDLFNVNESSALWIFVCSIALVVLVIVLIILLILRGNKYKKQAKNNHYEPNYLAAETVKKEPAVETVKEEKVEVKEESVKETVVEKPAPVVEKAEEKEESKIAETVSEEKVEKVEVTEEKEVKEEVTEVKEKSKPVEAPVKEKVTPAVKKAKAPATKVEEIKEEKVEVKETPVEEDQKSTRIVLGKYEIFHVSDMYLYRLKASNGEIMVISEIYKSEKGAFAAIDTVKKSIDTGTLQIYKDKHNLWQFKLFAANKRLLVVSANYQTQQGCESAANSFKKFATISPVVVLEEDPEHLMEELKLVKDADKKGGKIVVNALEEMFEFKLCASNGVVLCSSSEYASKAAVFNAVETFKNAISQGRFVVVKDKNDMYQFKLYTNAGRCIVLGEAYKNKVQAVSAANSVASFIKLAEVVDKTIVEKVSVEQ